MARTQSSAASRRHDDPRKVAVVGARLQRRGPPRGEREIDRPERAQVGEPGSGRGLGGEREREGAGVLQHDGRAHAQVAAGAGQLLVRGEAEGHRGSFLLAAARPLIVAPAAK